MKLKYLTIAVLLGAAASTGCNKSWLDVNTNPNTVTSSTPEYIFTNALTRMGTTTGNLNADETGSYYAGYWMQSSSYILVTNTFAYNFTNVDFNYWDGWYDILADFDDAKKKGEDSAYYNFVIGPSMIMKAMIFQQIVDVYGNAPYSDALKGAGSLAPKFDDHKAIYEGLIKDLDSAIAVLKSPAGSFPGTSSSFDVVFGGNKTNWIRLANSLKMRILIRQSRITGRDAYIIAEINKAAAVAEGFLTSADAGVNPGYLASTGKTNPYYDKWGYDPNGATRSLGRFPRPSKYLIDMFKSTGDSVRMKRQFYAIGGENGSTPGTSVRAELNSNYAGVPFGASSSAYTAGNVSPIGPSQLVKGQVNKRFMFFTAAETNFLLAEAKQLYGAGVTLAGTAEDYYKQGVRESYRQVGSTVTAANTLLANGLDLTDWTASPDKLKAIWFQKWIALVNFNGMEGWAEYRRTGFPAIPQSIIVSDPNKRPRRLFYPQSELGSNEANVEAQGTIDVFTNRLFWDVD
jgi:hypothetical protein